MSPHSRGVGEGDLNSARPGSGWCCSYHKVPLTWANADGPVQGVGRRTASFCHVRDHGVTKEPGWSLATRL